MADQRLVGQVNPIGAEHLVSVGVRGSLELPDELLFSNTHVELGVVNHVSPIYARTGGYLQLQPLAVLILRAELRQVTMWALDMPGAGYTPLAHDQGEGGVVARDTPDMVAGQATDARGWEAHFSLIAQGMVPLGPMRLLLWNQLGYERIQLGQAAAYVSPRHDLVLEREDGVLSNAAMLLGEVDLAPGLRLRVGSYDDLAYVPRSSFLVHQIGAIAAVSITEPTDGVAEVMPLVRGGYFTDGRRAGSWTGLVGMMVSYR